MTNQVALGDSAGGYGALFHSGTAGTSETIRQTGQATGAADVHIAGGTMALGTFALNNYAVDEGSMPATPNVMPIGGEYRATPTTYDDADATVLQTNLNGGLKTNALDDFHVIKCAPGAFNGTLANARGNLAGTNDPYTLLTVTGDALVGVYGVASGTMAGAGSVSVGPVGNTALMMAAIAGTNIPINSCWIDSTPAIGKPIDSLSFYLVPNGVDIVEDVSGTHVEGGNIYYVALWKPLTPNSNVVSAV